MYFDYILVTVYIFDLTKQFTLVALKVPATTRRIWLLKHVLFHICICKNLSFTPAFSDEFQHPMFTYGQEIFHLIQSTLVAPWNNSKNSPVNPDKTLLRSLASLIFKTENWTLSFGRKTEHCRLVGLTA